MNPQIRVSWVLDGREDTDTHATALCKCELVSDTRTRNLINPGGGTKYNPGESTSPHCVDSVLPAASISAASPVGASESKGQPQCTQSKPPPDEIKVPPPHEVKVGVPYPRLPRVTASGSAHCDHVKYWKLPVEDGGRYGD
ncbi:hypothetical protein M758_6G070700 [Ceratodon purpureus]|nr:hypothetical protein M758_6G070700 [Ceratodon purpureus]